MEEEMDLESMKRRDLQRLCRKHGISSNSTNSAMIESLRSIFQKQKNSKPKGCLKGSGESSGEGPKKVTFVLEDEEEEEQSTPLSATNTTRDAWTIRYCRRGPPPPLPPQNQRRLCQILCHRRRRGSIHVPPSTVGPPMSLIQWKRFLPRRSLYVLLVEHDDSTHHVFSVLLRKFIYHDTNLWSQQGSRD